MAVAQEIRRVASGLYTWQAYEPAVKCDLSSAAVVTPAGLVLIDPIALTKPALAALVKDAKPAAILLTNGNHARDADAYRKELGIAVWAHEGAASALEIEPDATLADGEIAPGGFCVMALNGAGPGEIALLGAGAACLGDAIINLPPEGLRLLPAKYCSDPVALPGSLRKLLSCEFDVLTFAHGAPLVGQARRNLEVLLS
jgi:Metallo-beta-lactamase superfamily